MIKIIPPNPPFWSRTSWIQIFFGIRANLAMVGAGLKYGTTYKAYVQIATTKNLPIDLPQNESIWMLSTLILFPIGSLLYGVIIDRYGRQLGLVLCQLPMCAGWSLISFAESPTVIVIGACFLDFGCGMIAGASRAYTTEISLPNMRAVLASFMNLAIMTGFMIQTNLTLVFSWKVIFHACNLYSCIVLVLNFFLPETPYFVLLSSTEEETKKALQKFRSKKYDVEEELKELLEFKSDNKMQRLSLLENLKAINTITACKPFCFIMVYTIILELGGHGVLFMWETHMIESLEKVHANISNITLSSMRILTCMAATVLLFFVGRRPLSQISALGVGIVCLVLGGIILNETVISWVVPIIIYCFYMFFARIGYNTLPLVMMYEIYPLQVRGTLGGITNSIILVWKFAVTNLYPYVRVHIGYGKHVMLFGLFNILGCVYLYLYMPETKDLTLPEIEEYYNHRRPTLVSERTLQTAQKLTLITSEANKMSNAMHHYKSKN